MPAPGVQRRGAQGASGLPSPDAGPNSPLVDRSTSPSQNVDLHNLPRCNTLPNISRHLIYFREVRGHSIANRPPTPIRVIASTHQLYEDVNINCTLDILFTSQWVRRCPQNCFFSMGIWAAIQGQGQSIMFGGLEPWAW